MWQIVDHTCITPQVYNGLAHSFHLRYPRKAFVPLYSLWQEDFLAPQVKQGTLSWAICSPTYVFENKGRYLPIQLYLDIDDTNLVDRDKLKAPQVVPVVIGSPWFEGIHEMFTEQFTEEELAELGCGTVKQGTTSMVVRSIPKRYSRYFKKENYEARVTYLDNAFEHISAPYSVEDLDNSPLVSYAKERIESLQALYDNYWEGRNITAETIQPYNVSPLLLDETGATRSVVMVELEDKTTPAKGIAFFFRESNGNWYWYGSLHNNMSRIGNALLIYFMETVAHTPLNLGVSYFPWKRTWGSEHQDEQGLRFTKQPRLLHTLINTVVVPKTTDGLFHRFLPDTLEPAVI